ncbi:hypothetical protein [Rhizobium mesoamericanum]|nr:hypothetical protein [Rhizobium mesoamericanum]
MLLGTRRCDLAVLTWDNIKQRAEVAPDGTVIRRFEVIEWTSRKHKKGKKGETIYHEVTPSLALCRRLANASRAAALSPALMARAIPSSR